MTRAAKLSPSMLWALELLGRWVSVGVVDSRRLCRTMRALCRRGLAVENPERIFTAVVPDGT